MDDLDWFALCFFIGVIGLVVFADIMVPKHEAEFRQPIIELLGVEEFNYEKIGYITNEKTIYKVRVVENGEYHEFHILYDMTDTDQGWRWSPKRQVSILEAE